MPIKKKVMSKSVKRILQKKSLTTSEKAKRKQEILDKRMERKKEQAREQMKYLIPILGISGLALAYEKYYVKKEIPFWEDPRYAPREQIVKNTVKEFLDKCPAELLNDCQEIANATQQTLAQICRKAQFKYHPDKHVGEPKYIEYSKHLNSGCTEKKKQLGM